MIPSPFFSFVGHRKIETQKQNVNFTQYLRAVFKIHSKNFEMGLYFVPVKSKGILKDFVTIVCIFFDLQTQEHPLYTVDADGVYLLQLAIDSKNEFDANVSIKMQGRYGYLSAADWPLLPVSNVPLKFHRLLTLSESNLLDLALLTQ